ncbi:unnamed protein product, partial [Heligmosomoides polygyrus]|uniref:Peptidase A1 domain-containing protein n=1 Tax=Heligmosomoides polygyrus TaxID=6339 RepID=A0A183GL04_HELPZ
WIYKGTSRKTIYPSSARTTPAAALITLATANSHQERRHRFQTLSKAPYYTHAGSVEQCTSFATATTVNIDAPTATGLVTKTDSADQPDVEQSSLDPIAQRGKPHTLTQSSRFQTSTAAVATITVDGQPISFQVDSASYVTIINKTTWELMGKPELQPPSLMAHSASRDRIHFIGQRQCTYIFNATSAQEKFYVSNNSSNLLGAEWISKLGIYSIMDSLPCSDPGNPTMINVSIANLEHDKVAAKLQATYPEVFKSDLGLYRPSKATLLLKPEAKSLRMRTYDGKQTAQQDLDVLFDMFNLERLPPTLPPAHQPTPIPPEQHALQQAGPSTHEDHLRRSTCIRQPTRRLHLDPHKKPYHDSM